MAVQVDEHERSMALAEIAMGQIRAFRQPATPRVYEVWYAYATGNNPDLNKTVNDILTRTGSFTLADADHIHEVYLAPVQLGDRLDTVGTRVMDEINQVMSMVDAAVGSTSSYTESLAGVSRQLGSADRDGLRTIVESLVQTAKDMETVNHRLEARLIASKQEIVQLQENLELVRHESLTDPLTLLANRKFFEQALAKATSDADARDEPLSLMLTDIDHFKTFNDSFGHLTGDQVLRLVAQSLKQNVKGQDIAARYGGEEFAVILPNTALRAAVTVAEHVRRAVMTKELMKRSTGEQLGRITLSIGVATWRAGDTLSGFIARADNCLYAAKRHGRNCVICETDPEVAPPTSQTNVA